MGTTLTGTTPQDTYDSLIKVTDNGPLSGSLKTLTDGLGNDSALALSTTAIQVTGINSTSANNVNTGYTADLYAMSIRQRGASAGISGSNFTAQLISAAGAEGLEIYTPNAKELVLGTNATERMRITSAGSVLVGTSSSDLTRNMIVAGTAGMAVQYAGNAGTYFDIAPAAANGAVTLTADARTGAYPDMIFRTSAAERVRITSGGVLQLTQGQIKFPATQVASADPNTLDDYEEGTWTVAITGSSSNPTYTGTTIGYYTKIGNCVNYHIEIELSSYTAGSGSARLSLPFTVGARGYNVAATQVRNVDFSNTGVQVNYEATIGTAFGVMIVQEDNAGSSQVQSSGLSASTVIRITGQFFV